MKRFEQCYVSGSPAALESFQETTHVSTRRFKGTGLVGRRAHRYEPERELSSNMMPCARWAKFDTTESIWNWLNVINGPVEPHRCSPCLQRTNRSSPSPSEPPPWPRRIPVLTALPSAQYPTHSLHSPIKALCRRGRHLHLYQLEPCVFIFTCTTLLFIHEFIFSCREVKKKKKSFLKRGGKSWRGGKKKEV